MPRGEYRVTLHFAEIHRETPGIRRFHVLIEGQKELDDFDPGEVGFASAQERFFDTRVDDGMLDIEFVPVSDVPKISAIEIKLPGE